LFVSNIHLDIITSELCNLNSSMVSEQTRRIVEAVLFNGIEDSFENGDVILTFGSPDCLRYRAVKAFESYAAGRAEKIILSGGVTIPNTGYSEAQSMWDLLTGLGAHNSDIYLETASKFTHENVLFSSDIIRAVFKGMPVKILAVTSYDHMRRVLLNFQHYKNLFAEGTRFMPVPSGSTQDCEPYLWQSTPNGRKTAARELTNIVTYIRKGYLPDFQIYIN